jgi:hypothetical protein
MTTAVPDAPLAPVAPPTPRRANTPANVREWIFSKACRFRYYEEGARTKEEKRLFLEQLAKKVAARFPDTGAWDEVRAGTLVRNLKKTTPAPSLPPSSPPPPVVRSSIEQMLLDWQTTLTAASRLNGGTLARHSSNRGTCNEELLRGFLRAVLGSSCYVGIGSGEVLGGGGDGASPRQLDVVIYNTEFPCLRPARFGGGESDSNACYYRESIMGIVEVKTTLTNQDLRDVSAAAALLAPLPLLVFAFDSQSTLKAIDCGSLPDNVLGIYTLSHGSIVRVEGDTCWRSVQPFEQAPLVAFYTAVLGLLGDYALALPPLQRVINVLRRQLDRADSDESSGGGGGGGTPPEKVLRDIDLNHLTLGESSSCV